MRTRMRRTPAPHPAEWRAWCAPLSSVDGRASTHESAGARARRRGGGSFHHARDGGAVCDDIVAWYERRLRRRQLLLGMVGRLGDCDLRFQSVADTDERTSVMTREDDARRKTAREGKKRNVRRRVPFDSARASSPRRRPRATLVCGARPYESRGCNSKRKTPIRADARPDVPP